MKNIKEMESQLSNNKNSVEKIPGKYRSVIFEIEEKEHCYIVKTIDGIYNLPNISHSKFKNSRTALYNYLKDKYLLLNFDM